MLFPPFAIRILQLIYPIDEPNRTRDRPLEVLAVGLSRSGTDSLRKALKCLGYNECHHAFVFLAEEVGQGPQWCRLALRKYHTDPALSPAERGLDAREFDRCIGNCMATTDMPGATFASELIKAYPKAKVIVNKREDVEAWYQSILKTFGTQSPFGSWSVALFDSELFWLKAGRDALWSHLVEYDFARTGRDLHRNHYAGIEKTLAAEKAAGRERKVLRWKVEDGWDGLVEFLGKEIPKDEAGTAMEFPNGNDVDEFHRRRMAVVMERVGKAKTRRTILSIAVAGLLLAIVVRFWLL